MRFRAAFAVSVTMGLLTGGTAASAADPPPATAAPATKPATVSRVTSAVDPSLNREAQAAIDRGLDWLAKQQKEDGSWSNGDFPALTGLAVWAFAAGPHPARATVVSNAVRFIRGCVQDDGGIYRKLANRKGGGLSNYNTALCMAALQALDDPTLEPIIRNARRYIASAQHHGDDPFDGGMGYDATSDRAYADLNNSIFAYEAMRLTEGTEARRPAGEPKVDLDWTAAIGFATRCQNTADAGAPYVGGFFYRPGESKAVAGAITNAAGRVVYTPQGSMTYAGLLCLRYGKVATDDPRVKAGLTWSAQHWSLDENPGSGGEGQYSYYHLLAKVLVAYGPNAVPLQDKLAVDGRSELIRKLSAIQKIDPATGQGYWVNETGRYWEADPVLTTAYALLAMELLAP